MIIGALKTAHAGMRKQADIFAAAVKKVNDATLPTDEVDVPTGENTPRPGGSDLLLDGMTDMILAQRAFSANLRAAQAAAEMMEEGTEL